MKVHWSVKLSAFAGSVITLSWFFAGWRAVNEEGGWTSWALILAATAATFLLLGLQGYWIYFEEKEKGNLRRRIELFERIRAALRGGPKRVALAADTGEPGADE